MNTRHSSALFFATLYAGCLILAIAVAETATGPVISRSVEQQHPAGTEIETGRDAFGYPVQIRNTYDDQGRLIKREEDDRNGTLHKRTIFTYPKGFKKPNTSNTDYGPDGKTITSTTNEDFDKDGNPTSTVTTNYDAGGKETGGNKRERDPKTGQDACYNWNAAKQTYEKVECPKPIISEELFQRLAPRRPQPNIEFTPGLQKVNFDTSFARVVVNLPDDMMAGDTISGTVVTEPKGATNEERERNLRLISDATFAVTNKGNTNSEYRVRLIGDSPISEPPLQLIKTKVTFKVSAAFQCALQDGSQNIVQVNIDVPRIIGGEFPEPPNRETIPPFLWPMMGQQGRPIVVTGPFDGNSSNTQLNWTRPRSAVQDFEKNTENVSGGFGLLAESPRKAVFSAPTNVTGPIEINLKEGNKETRGTYRNVGVNLTAPKTNLMKGESTELHVEVQGLQGITQPIPLHLTKGGVVTMQGGDTQTMSIKPAEVQANGTFTTTRTITGVQAGVWNATATVVVFDVCLQDDKTGNELQINSTTGDYIFCVFPTVVAGDPGRVNIPWYGITTPDTGSVGWRGCTFTLEHKSTDGRVTAQSDRCSQTGSATVQPASSKTKFTITDRDTKNNTCTCK